MSSTYTFLGTTSPSNTTQSVTFATGTAKQINADQDVEFLLCVMTAVAFELAYGPSSSTTISLVAANMSGDPPKGSVISIRVPAGWYVKLTCSTMADLACYAITC